jgi:aspartate-semialdehyde dehydrogenase
LASRPVSKTRPYRVAIVGSDTLLGRELEEVIKARASGVVITPYAANAEGSFSNQDDEAVYINELNAKNMAEENAVVLAGTEDGTSKAFQLAGTIPRAPVLIDCTGFLERQPDAQVIMPLSGETGAGTSRVFVLANAAAMACALVLLRLARAGTLRQSIVHVFEPASELGKHGINELHQQTTSLLAFKPLEKKVFDTQLSFNMLAQYGEEAATKLLSSEQRIGRDISTLLRKHAPNHVPMPSVRLLQAPVFHGYSISLWVEFESQVTAISVAEALASAQIEIRGQDEEAPNNVGAVGQSGLIAGDIRLDDNNPRAAWIWVVADNLRLIADGVVDLLTEIRKPVQ